MKKQFMIQYQIDIEGFEKEIGMTLTKDQVKSIHKLLMKEVPPLLFSIIISYLQKINESN